MVHLDEPTLTSRLPSPEAGLGALSMGTDNQELLDKCSSEHLSRSNTGLLAGGVHKDLMKQTLQMGLHDSKGKWSLLCTPICVVVRS